MIRVSSRIAPLAIVALLLAGPAWAQVPGRATPGVVNVADYGARCNGRTDDRAAIEAAVNALPASGGILQFPAGTCLVTSSSALLMLTDKNAVWIRGVNMAATTLKQAGTGNAITLTGTTEIGNIRVSDLALEGSNTAAKGIASTNCKDCLFERLNINGFLNHGIELAGAANLHNVIRDNRITSGTVAVANARGVSAQAGNGNHVMNVYFNNGGNDPNHYQVALDVSGCGACSSIGNIFDGVPTAIRSSSSFVSISDWFDGGNVTKAYQHTANNPLTVLNPVLTTMAMIDTTGISSRWITVIGHVAAAPSQLAGYGGIQLPTLAFADLGAQATNGSVAYCSNCTTTTPCAGGGTGAVAKRINGVWVCN